MSATSQCAIIRTWSPVIDGHLLNSYESFQKAFGANKPTYLSHKVLFD